MVAVMPCTCGLDAAADVSGVTEKMLIRQLRELESRDIVHREVFHQVPPKVEYSLTKLGELFNVALMPLDQWGADHLAEIEASRTC